MEETVRSYLDGQQPGSGFAVHYLIGNPFTGETDFLLRSDGNYELSSTVTRDRQPRSYSGRVDASEVAALAHEILDVKLWEVRHVDRVRRVDDPGAIIEVQGQGGSSQVQLWVSEIPDRPAFGRVQSRLLEMVHRLTGGEVLEEGK